VAGVPARPICTYQEFVRRSVPRCRYYPPEVTGDRRKLRRVLMDTIPYPSSCASQEE